MKLTEKTNFEPMQSVEAKEREGKKILRLLVCTPDSSTWGKFGKLGARWGETGVGFVSRKKNIQSLEEQFKEFPDFMPDMLLLAGTSPEREKELITWLRNNPELSKQPFIITTSLTNKGAERRIAAGADLDIRGDNLIQELFSSISNIRELTDKVENLYAEKMAKQKQGFYTEYKDKLAPRSEVTADTQKEVEILEDIFQRHQVKNVLDAGCGEGRIAGPLSEKGYKVTGIDGSSELIKKAKARNLDQAQFMVGDLRKITDSVEPVSQDAVTFCWHVICDILGNRAKKEVLDGAYKTLKPGGVIILDIPGTREENKGVYLDDPGGEHIYIGYVPSIPEMTKLLEDAGFKNIEVKKWQTETGFPKTTFIAEKI